MATKRILLDVGGTFIKCSDGREIPINSDGSREEIISSLKQAVSGYSTAFVAIPGPFRYSDGTFLMKHKFESVYGEKFKDITGIRTCFFAHDVNAMLAGELDLMKSKGYDNVALVTIGTGLGFAISIDGMIMTNEVGTPRFCIYNRPFMQGNLEDYVSKRGLLRGYDGITVKELSDLARNGDKAAIQRFNECGEYLGANIASILQSMNIQCLLLGGQISKSYDLFKDTLKDKLSSVSSLKSIGPVSDIDNATFNGLLKLFNN